MKILDNAQFIFNPETQQILCQIQFRESGALHTVVVDQSLKIIQAKKMTDGDFVSLEDYRKVGAVLWTKGDNLKLNKAVSLEAGFYKAKERLFILNRVKNKVESKSVPSKS